MLMMLSLRRTIGMRNRRKYFQGTLLNIALVLAIAFSVILTGFVFSSFGKNEAPSVSESQQPEQRLLEMFRPTQYIVTQSNGQQKLVVNDTDEKIKGIRRAVTQSTLDEAQTKTVTTGQIKKILSTKKSQIFRYPDVIPISYFNTRYEQHIVAQKTFNFNYFVLPLDHKKEGYFVNTKTDQVTTVKVSKLNSDQVWQQVDKLPTHLTVDFKAYNGRVVLNYPQKIKLPVYSYLVNHRDPKTYVSSLLGTLNQLTITQDDAETVYTNKLNNQQITYDPSWETVKFEDHNPKNKLPKTYLDRLNSNFSQINLLQLDLTDTRFYESQDNGKKITFRTYVEGFPVYFQSQSGAIHMTMDNHGNLTSTYSLNELGVPVPNRQADVELPATETVIKQLTDAGVKTSDYNFITPGYEWLINEDSQAAVNMEPTWMIETHDGWQSVTSYLRNR